LKTINIWSTSRSYLRQNASPKATSVPQKKSTAAATHELSDILRRNAREDETRQDLSQ